MWKPKSDTKTQDVGLIQDTVFFLWNFDFLAPHARITTRRGHRIAKGPMQPSSLVVDVRVLQLLNPEMGTDSNLYGKKGTKRNKEQFHLRFVHRNAQSRFVCQLLIKFPPCVVCAMQAHKSVETGLLPPQPPKK